MSNDSVCRVVVIDDSAVIRSVITRTINRQEDMDVVGMAENGQAGIEAVERYDPDIVVLDIEMPVMDGITALPLILEKKPDVHVLICSTLSDKGASISMKALSLGAAECILKPGGNSIITAADFKENLVGIIRGLCAEKKQKTLAAAGQDTVTLKQDLAPFKPKILAIGSSTGGPKALLEVLKDLNNLPVPIVITQHMPKTFTGLLAENITKKCGLSCYEGQEGDILKPGCAYVAPGGYHMILKKTDAGTAIHLSEEPPENFCRPSVDPMMRSLMSVYDHQVLALILTGMGSDGLQSCKDLSAKGGRVIAQDEATSVVWGMPGAVAKAGICSAILPLTKIADHIKNKILT